MYRQNEKINKQIERSYQYYINASNTIPGYMLRNLKNMPNNKGYKWRDICFFGELPDENNNKTTIFEKQVNKLLILSLYTSPSPRDLH